MTRGPILTIRSRTNDKSLNSPYPFPANEPQRLAALRACQILDTPPEPVFDNVVHLAARITGAPIALISLIDESRQWFKASIGLPVHETPREQAFCTFAILGSEIMVVEDAALDARFRDNLLVTGEPGIRFYAGAPLEMRDGTHPGTLCVIDVHPRTFSATDQEALRALARLVVLLLEQRQQGLKASRAAPKTVADLKALFRQFAVDLRAAPREQAEKDFGELLLYLIQLASELNVDLFTAGDKQIALRAFTPPEAVPGDLTPSGDGET